MLKKEKIYETTAVYQLKNGSLQLKADTKSDTIWANLMQIAELFDTHKSGISRHIYTIYKSGELDREGTVAKFATVQKEGNRKIVRNLEYYNLDIILAVGYRVNSSKAIMQVNVNGADPIPSFLTPPNRPQKTPY